jgi:homoserine kinase type II
VIHPPVHLLRDAQLTVMPGVIQIREGRAWLVDWQGTRGLVRCRQAADSLVDDVRWLHGFLAGLTDLGFPSPRPLPSFGGRSWALADGHLWEIVSFIPGHEVGWDEAPGMEEIGSLLARFHAAVRRLPPARQRPGAVPLADVPRVLLSARLDADHLDPDLAAVIRGLAERLAGDLATGGQVVVIHGDFTNHNVIASGAPPRPVGVIDFQCAHVERPVADIAYGLWRSGRPHQDAAWLDPGRLRRFVGGYASTGPLAADDVGLLPIFLYGRGLQRIAKRVIAGEPWSGMLAQVQWIIAKAAAIADAAVAALP